MSSVTCDENLAMPRNSDEHSNEPLCPKCFQPILGTEDFCNNCGLPLTLMATSGPYEHTLAVGYAYREASSNPRKPIVVLGVWLLMGPTFLFAVAMIVVGLFHLPAILESMKSFETFVSAFLAAGFLFFWTYVSGKLLLRTTVNYRKRQVQLDHD
jgi:hypothetical protein